MGYNAAGFDIAKDQVDATKARVRFLLKREVKLPATKNPFVVPWPNPNQLFVCHDPMYPVDTC